VARQTVPSIATARREEPREGRDVPLPQGDGLTSTWRVRRRRPKARRLPDGRRPTRPGMRSVSSPVTIHPRPNILHCFQRAGGRLVSEFSTRSTDGTDVFTDPEIHRFTRRSGSE